MCVERMEGVLMMAANINALPKMDMSISGALRIQLMMTTVSGREWREKSSVPDSLFTWTVKLVILKSFLLTLLSSSWSRGLA